MTTCDIEAFKDLELEALNLDDRMSFLEIVNKENYDDAKKSFGALVPGYFDGNYDEFARKWAKLSAEKHYTRNLKLARSLFTAKLTKNGLKAYMACVGRNSGGAELFANVLSNDENGAQVEILWEPPEGTLGRLYDMHLDLEGGEFNHQPKYDRLKGFTGSLRVNIDRFTPSSVIKLEVAGRLEKGAQRSASAYIPAPRPPLETFDRVDVGEANDLYFPLPINEKRDRTIQFEAHYLVHYETPGDPTHEMTVYINDEPPILQKSPTRGDVNNRYVNDMSFSTTRIVKAGQPLTLKLHVNNFRTKSDRLYLDVREI